MWREVERHGINCRGWLIPVIRGSVELRTVYVGAVQAKAGEAIDACLVMLAWWCLLGDAWWCLGFGGACFLVVFGGLSCEERD